jgi:glycine/D-amino acid oxidase-like deaminating enzyme
VQIIIIGAGVFGSWCAWFLAERHHRVTLIDAYGAANARASSADHSRVIRCGYGRDEIYSRWARASLDDWRALAERTRQELLVPSGALFLGAPGNTYISLTHATLTRIGLDVQVLDGDALGSRFPQLAQTGLGPALIEHGAGVIRARAAVQTLVRLMVEERRVAYRIARVAAPDESHSSAQFHLTTGEPLGADMVICACGPWLPALLPIAVGDRIRPTRQEVLHFGVPAGDDRFSLTELPVWIDFDAGLYGIPDFDARGFKIGIDRHGPPIDPDTADRVVTSELVARTRDWLGGRFPALSNAPLLDAHVCQYENTHTGDFLIDRHPAWANVWIVGGGSGHGFKHGPAVGRYVAASVEGSASVDPRFALSAQGTEASRAVY